MTHSLHRWIQIAGLLLSSAFITACGGGSGDGDGGTPPPPTLTITTTTLPAGAIGTAYSQTIAATGGTGARTFTVTTGTLPAGLTLNAGTAAITGTPTGPAGTVNFTVTVVDTGTPQQNDTQALSIAISAPPPLTITTTTLPAGIIGTAYSRTIAATGGTGARTFTVTTGALPAGLTLNAGTGAITGTPTGPAGTLNFTVTVVDSGTPQQSDTQALSIEILATAVGRNDSIATATTLTNGSFAASISPSGDPSTVFDPDEDFYRITTTTASTVTININAQSNGSPMDSVIEIVDAGGVTLNTCVDPDFNSPCVDDDEDPGVLLDSFLQVRVAGATTFYVHVVDWRGDARPDHLYTIVVSGIN